MSDSEEEKQEVELAEWVQIQKKTFTRWCNEQLKVKELAIDDLSTGLKDGVNLVHLVGLLTQKPAKRYNKKPRMRVQMMENIGFALDILNKDGIKLVNIGREDICDGNIKLILGLIWTLILHYQISVDFGGDSEGKKNTTAKKELQNWATGLINSLQEDTGGKKVKNFTTDWNDGIALCTMVEAVAPGLCPEYSTLDPKNALDNVKLGFDRAEEGLGVAKIIEVEDMVNPLIDELSVLTYVSLLKSASPKIDIQKPDPLKVRIYGPGVDTAYINSPTEFFIDFKNAGFGKLDVKILDGKGEEVPIELWKKDGETRVQYAPTEPGKLKFNVLYNGTLVPNGDAIVRVLTPSDVNGVKLSGDGLNSGVVGKESEFVADVTDAGDGDLDVSIVGVDGKIPVKLDVQESDRKLVMVKFTPTKAGPTLITVKFNNEELPESPLHVEVVDDIDPLKVKILAVGVGDAEVNKPVKFIVSTEGAGNGDLKVKVLDKDGVPLKVTVEDLDGENKQVTFTPQEPGDLHVSVKWSDKTVPNGEFDVEVHKPLDLKACIVTDLKNPIVGIPTRFSVDLSKVGADDLAVEAVDKNGDPLNVVIDDIGDLKYQVTYTAQEPGPVKLNVKIEDQHVPGSAFTVYGVDPSKVVIDLDKHKYTVGEPVEIGLDMTEAGPGQLDVQLAAPVGSGTDCSAAEVSPGKMVVTFTPTEPGEHNIKLTLDDQQIPSTPICLTVRPKPNAGQVNVNGEGVREGEVGKPSVFTVDTSKAGPGNLDVKVKGPKDPLTCNIIEVGDGLYEVTYVPKEEGPHVVAVKFADQHVPGSAFRPNVLKGLNPDNVVAYGKGLEEGSLKSESEFYVDTSRAGDGDLQIKIDGPVPVEPTITPLSTYHYKVVYAVPQEGEYKIDITFDDIHIPKSPFHINVRTPFNPSSVLATGPGLLYGIVGRVSLFEVDCAAAGNAPLNINVEDDEHELLPVKVTETQPNCYDVSFVPQKPIPHHVNVLWNNFNIKGSPFKVNVIEKPEKDINLGGEGKIRVYYSTTTSSEKIRHNCRFLQSLMERKKVHLREDFEPWIPIDIGMDREERNRIFDKAGVRKTPMLFIDDQYVGDYDDVIELDECGELDRLLSYCALKYRNLHTIEEARKADELLKMKTSG